MMKFFRILRIIHYLACCLFIFVITDSSKSSAQQPPGAITLIYIRDSTLPACVIIGNDSVRVMGITLEEDLQLRSFDKFVVSSKAFDHLSKFVADRCPNDDAPYGHGKVKKTIIATVAPWKSDDRLFCVITAPVTTASYFKEMLTWLQASPYSAEAGSLLEAFENLED